jgi:hypothetical protein
MWSNKNIIKVKIVWKITVPVDVTSTRLPSPTIILEGEEEEGGVVEERVPASEATWLVAPVSKYQSWEGGCWS